MSDLAEICTKGSIQGEENTVFKNFWLIQIFTETARCQSLHFFLVFPQLWPHFTLKRRPKSKKKYISRTKFSHRAIQILQNQGPSCLDFSGKIRLLFALFWLFFAKKRGLVSRWRVGIIIWPTLFQFYNSWACFCARSFVPALPSFAAITTKGLFNLNPLFQVWLLFQVPRPYIW